MGNKLEYLNIKIEKEKYNYEQLKYDIAFRLVDSRFVVFNKPKQIKKIIEKLDQDYQRVLEDVDKAIMTNGLVDVRKNSLIYEKNLLS